MNILQSVPLQNFKYKYKLDALEARVQSMSQVAGPPLLQAADDSESRFRNRKGDIVSVQRLRRQRSTTDNEKRSRVAKAILRLREAGVDITNRNIRQMGLSALSVNQYYKDLK